MPLLNGSIEPIAMKCSILISFGIWKRCENSQQSGWPSITITDRMMRYRGRLRVPITTHHRKTLFITCPLGGGAYTSTGQQLNAQLQIQFNIIKLHRLFGSPHPINSAPGSYDPGAFFLLETLHTAHLMIYESLWTVGWKQTCPLYPLFMYGLCVQSISHPDNPSK